MRKTISKKIVALLLMAVMLMAMSMMAFADDANSSTKYNVTIYKDGSSDVSMANDIVNGQATVTTLESGKVQIVIPIKPIEDYVPMSWKIFAPADGYLREATVVGADSSTIDADADELYTSSTWTIVMPKDTVISSGTKLDANDAKIDLYYANTSNTYIKSHLKKNFDVEFEADSSESAD